MEIHAARQRPLLTEINFVISDLYLKSEISKKNALFSNATAKNLCQALKTMHKSKKKCKLICILKIMCNFAKSF
jgi:hypothetical protein